MEDAFKDADMVLGLSKPGTFTVRTCWINEWRNQLFSL